MMRTRVPESGIKGRDKQLYHTVSVGCNYLSLPSIPTFGTQVHMYAARGPHELICISLFEVSDQKTISKYVESSFYSPMPGLVTNATGSAMVLSGRRAIRS